MTPPLGRLGLAVVLLAALCRAQTFNAIDYQPNGVVSFTPDPQSYMADLQEIVNAAYNERSGLNSNTSLPINATARALTLSMLSVAGVLNATLPTTLAAVAYMESVKINQVDPQLAPSSPPPPPLDFLPAPPVTVPQLPPGTVYAPRGLFSYATGCPASRSVRVYGAVGNGSSDDSTAFYNADRAQPYVYVPPGVFRLARSITLTKPMLTALNSYIVIDAGVTVTMQGQILRGGIQSQGFISGGGVVRFSRDVEVVPDWFRSYWQVDVDALQAAADSCQAGCTLLLTRNYALTRQWYINPTNGVFGTNGSMVLSFNNYGKGVMFRPGRYSRSFVMQSVRNFPDFCIKVQGGVENVDIQVGSVSYCNVGVSFDTTTTSQKTIKGGGVSHISVMQMNQHNIVFQAGATTDTFDSVIARANFILMGGGGSVGAPASGAGYFGTPPRLINNTQVVFQAVDPAQFIARSRFSTIWNFASGAVANAVVSAETWVGGYEAGGRQVTGSFDGLQSMLYIAGGIAWTEYFDLASSGYTTVSTGQIGNTGVLVNALPRGGNLASFNGGKPLIQNLDFLALAPDTDWLPGRSKDFTFYHVWAATGIAAGRMQCIYSRWFNPGIVCSNFANLNSTSKYRMTVTLTNTTPFTFRIQDGWSFVVGIQAGP